MRCLPYGAVLLQRRELALIVPIHPSHRGVETGNRAVDCSRHIRLPAVRSLSARCTSFALDGRTLTMQTEEAQVHVTVLAPDLVRVQMVPDGAARRGRIVAVVRRGRSRLAAPVDCGAAERDRRTRCTLRSGRLGGGCRDVERNPVR